MYQDLLVYVYAITTGFVFGGVIGSFYQLVTGRRINFELLMEGGPIVFVTAFALALAGPIVVMRNAIRGQFIDRRPGHWLALSTLISALWSFMSGVFVLSFALTFLRA